VHLGFQYPLSLLPTRQEHGRANVSRLRNFSFVSWMAVRRRCERVARQTLR
jgi:hypothetical protein